MLLKRNQIIFAVIMIVSLSFSVIAALLPEGQMMLHFFNRDDAFYYFKVAQNISEGYGITFDRISVTNGFHPLWMLICIPIFALARFDLILPFRVLLVLLGMLNAGTILLLYLTLRKTISEQVGLVGACIWAFSSSIQALVSRMGLETGLTAFFIMLLIYTILLFDIKSQWKSTDYLRFSVLALLVLMSRLDTIFLVIFFGIWLIFRNTPLRQLLIIDMVAPALAIALSFYLRLGSIGGASYTIAFRPAAFAMTILGIIIHPLVNGMLGLYRQFTFSRENRFSTFFRLVASSLVSSVVLAFVMIVLQEINFIPTFSRAIPLLEFILSFTFTLFGRILFQLINSNTDSRIIQFPKAFWKTTLTQGLLYFGPAALVLIIYIVINKLYAGSWMPVSGQIKQWWAALEYTVYGQTSATTQEFVNSFFSIWSPISQSILQPISEWSTSRGLSLVSLIVLSIFLLFTLPLVVVFMMRRFPEKQSIGYLLPLLAGSLIQYIYYDVIGYVASKEWYWVSQMVFLVILLSYLLGWVIVNTRNHRWRMVFGIFISLGCFALFINYCTSFGRTIAYTKITSNPYVEEALFIEDHTEPGSLVGMTGGGTVAYFINQRTIINLDGLINSIDYFSALKENRAAEYLENIDLAYIYGNDYMLTQSIPYNYIFLDHLEPIEHIPTGTLYRFRSIEP